MYSSFGLTNTNIIEKIKKRLPTKNIRHMAESANIEVNTL